MLSWNLFKLLDCLHILFISQDRATVVEPPKKMPQKVQPVRNSFILLRYIVEKYFSTFRGVFSLCPRLIFLNRPIPASYSVFYSFRHITIQIDKSVDGKLGIRNRADESTKLWLYFRLLNADLMHLKVNKICRCLDCLWCHMRTLYQLGDNHCLSSLSLDIPLPLAINYLGLASPHWPWLIL